MERSFCGYMGCRLKVGYGRGPGDTSVGCSLAISERGDAQRGGGGGHSTTEWLATLCEQPYRPEEVNDKI